MVLRKDVTFTFRMPAVVRGALDRARGDLTAARFVLQVVANDLARRRASDRWTAIDAVARAPRSDRGQRRSTDGERAPRRGRSRATSERVARDRVPRDAKPNASRRRRKARSARH